ncbi:MAG: four helix bundle protein [Planctomycetaceae bacterium]|nr:MAG: four helix bundle protein [Planctomycetaceae bacterium]
MTPEEMKTRTKALGLRIFRLVDSLPSTRSADVIGRQLLRSATSVGANYRAACRAKSVADFIAKMRIVEEEADETAYWIEVIIDANLMPEKLLRDLQTECNEIVSIVVASIKTARGGARTK